MKSVLVMAGAGKRANPNLPENITLILAMYAPPVAHYRISLPHDALSALP